MQIFLAALIVFTSLLVIVVTALPLIRTPLGIIRICDFPRPQILVLGVGSLAAIHFYFGWQNGWALALAAAVLAAVTAQGIRIARYTPLHPKESHSPGNVSPEDCLTVLIANVQQENRSPGKLIEMLQRFDPDIAFIAETDAWWCDQLAEVSKRYPHVSPLPQDNKYGLLFLSRLTVESCELRRLVEPDVPSVKARLRLGSGRTFWFFGLHPRPPLPTEDVEDRNTELLIVAREIRDHRQPSIVAGDLNDVAWSRTNDLFQRVSGTVDPRVGRSLFATFHADHWFARWPLDHLFYTPEFGIEELKVLPHIGSDHFPVLGRLCFTTDDGPQRSRAGSGQDERRSSHSRAAPRTPLASPCSAGTKRTETSRAKRI